MIFAIVFAFLILIKSCEMCEIRGEKCACKINSVTFIISCLEKSPNSTFFNLNEIAISENVTNLIVKIENNDLLFTKWKKVLRTNIQKMIRITFKKAGSTTSLVKFNKKFNKFLNSKLNKFKDDYTLFLNDLLNKKLINKKDFKIKSIKKKLILKAIYKSISKFCINKT